MSATIDISLADYSAASKTFTPAVQIANGYQYSDTSSTVNSPRTLQVKHVMLPVSAQTGVDVHTVSFAHTVPDGTLGKNFTASVALTLRIPRTGPTLTNRRDLWTFIKNFLNDANVEKLLIGGY